MATSEKRKIWIIADHPMQFAIALALASYLGRGKFATNLFISPHPYWRKVDIGLYKDLFDKVVYLERPDYTWHPIQLLRMILQIQQLKRKIADLHIAENDIIIGLSIFHYLENVLLSTHRRNLKVAIMPAVVYHECTRSMDRRENLPTLEGWLASRLVEPITGLHRTYCMKDRFLPKEYWRIRYKDSLTDIYDKIIVMGHLRPEEKPTSNKVMVMPYPYILALGETRVENYYKAGKPRKVVFFGDAFKGGTLRLTPQVWAGCLNECLSFLRERYGATHQLVYRPHPQETDEIQMLNLEQFKVEDDGMLAELYFYKYFDDIYAVFSFGSTASRSALHFFLNAYAFLDIFPFDEAARKLMRLEMGNVPDDFYINDLSKIPNRYIRAEDASAALKRCRDTLDSLLVLED